MSPARIQASAQLAIHSTWRPVAAQTRPPATIRWTAPGGYPSWAFHGARSPPLYQATSWKLKAETSKPPADGRAWLGMARWPNRSAAGRLSNHGAARMSRHRSRSVHIEPIETVYAQYRRIRRRCFVRAGDKQATPPEIVTFQRDTFRRRRRQHNTRAHHQECNLIVFPTSALDSAAAGRRTRW